jgi:hypothetical protein
LTRPDAERAAWAEIVAEWTEFYSTDRKQAEAELIAMGLARPSR